MKKYIIGLLIVIALFTVLAVLGKDDSQTTQQPAQTFSTISKSVSKGALLLDVRTAEEYAASHFIGAKNFPLQDMHSGTLPEVSKSDKIYVYCHSGNRAGQATDILKKAGYTNVADLGGLTDVESIGGKLVKN